jgi:hypothetical protein
MQKDEQEIPRPENFEDEANQETNQENTEKNESN